jgi:hypothetical protein
VRLFIALWLAVVSIQSTDLLALIAPDSCADAGTGVGGADDPCEGDCARCVCCTRVPTRMPVVTVWDPAPSSAGVPPTLIDLSSNAAPRGILHVPKTR